MVDPCLSPSVVSFYRDFVIPNKIDDAEMVWRQRRKRRILRRTRATNCTPIPKMEGGLWKVTVYTDEQIDMLEHGGAKKIDILHIASYLSKKRLYKVYFELCVWIEKIRIPAWMFKILNKLKWFNNLPKVIRNRIEVRSCPRKFWTDSMINIVKRMKTQGGRDFRYISAYIFRNYDHCVTWRWLYHKWVRWL